MSNPQDKETQLGQLFYNPGDMTDLVVRYAETVAKQQGLTWGIGPVDQKTVPVMPGQVMTIIGRPGNGKSTLLGWHAKRAAQQCGPNEVVVHVTYEQAVEQADLMFWANDQFSTSDLSRGAVPPELLRAMAPERVKLPIWLMGESVIRQQVRGLRMTVANTYQALRLIRKNYNLHVKLLLVDYAQIIAVEAKTPRVEAVTESMVEVRELARTLACPVIEAAQASRAAEARGEEQLPTLYDCQWASAIEQNSDQVYGIWRPVTTRRGRGFKWQGHDVQVNDTHLLMRLLKDRWGPGAGETWCLYFEPQRLKLGFLEESDL